jgi:hypothetical protein
LRFKNEEFIMKFIDTGDPDILQTRRGGGWLMLFGLPFLLTGLFVIGFPFLGSPPPGGGPPLVVTVIFGSVFTVLGTALMFGRSGMTINRRKGSIVQWSGLLVPMKKTTYPLGYYDRITIRKDLRRSKKRTYYAYPIALKGSHGTREGIVFDEPTDYPQARRTAEEITTYLRLPLVDTTSGKDVVREPDKLDESIRERAKRTKESVASFHPPPGMRARVTEESGTLVIEIPPQKLTREHYKRMAVLMIIGAAALCAVMGVNNLRHLNAQNLMVYAPLGIFVLLFASRTILRQTRRSCRITASRDMLRVEQRTSKRREVTEIPVDELEDFVMGDANLPAGVCRTPDGRYQAEGLGVPPRDYGGYSGHQVMAGTKLLSKLSLIIRPPGPSITASSDEATVNFGQGLREDELGYIYALIKKKITE